MRRQNFAHPDHKLRIDATTLSCSCGKWQATAPISPLPNNVRSIRRDVTPHHEWANGLFVQDHLAIVWQEVDNAHNLLAHVILHGLNPLCAHAISGICEQYDPRSLSSTTQFVWAVANHLITGNPACAASRQLLTVLEEAGIPADKLAHIELAEAEIWHVLMLPELERLNAIMGDVVKLSMAQVIREAATTFDEHHLMEVLGADARTLRRWQATMTAPRSPFRQEVLRVLIGAARLLATATPPIEPRDWFMAPHSHTGLMPPIRFVTAARHQPLYMALNPGDSHSRLLVAAAFSASCSHKNDTPR